MELQQIRYFLSIHSHGSFSRAASECAVSQPALTASIKKLENEIGGPLFYREGKRLLMTPLGRLVRPALEQVVAGTQSARDIAQNFKLLRQAPLRLGVLGTIGPTLLSRVFARFHRNYPGVELTVQEGSNPELMQQLEVGEIDLAVTSTPEPLADNFRCETLFTEPYVVAFAPGNPLGRFEKVRLADVDGEPYVDRLSCELREAVMALTRQSGVNLYATFRSQREDWVESMVLAGLGFAFMPLHSVRSSQLQHRPLVEPKVERKVMAVDVRGRQRPEVAELLLEEMRRFEWQATAAA
jgi:DNA-binding transcriptional LysR family regulator